MQASGKEQMVVCRVAIIRMSIPDWPSETSRRGSCKTFNWRRSFVAQLRYLQSQAEGVDFLQTLNARHRLG
jgi:hypothetical protein